MNKIIKNLFFLLIIPLNIFSIEKIPAAYLIADQVKRGLETQEDKYLFALIAGIEARDNGILLTSDEERAYSSFVEKQRDFLAQKNLREAENWMKNLQFQDGINFIIPTKLAYFVVKKGDGRLLTQKHGKVLVNYIIKKEGSLFPEVVVKDKELDLAETIPGFSHGILSMSEGEIRTIYIHPELAYGVGNFEPNVVLEATVELLKILPGDRAISQINNPPLQELPEITPEELDKFKLASYYAQGWKLWDYLRWGHKFFTKENIVFYLQKDPLELTNSDYQEEINIIHWNIYQQRIEDENTAADDYLKKISSETNVKCLASGYLYCQAQKLRKTPVFTPVVKAKTTIKDREGRILRNERIDTIILDDTIKGLKEGLPYLIQQEPATLFIHPMWAFHYVDGPLGDILLVVDIEIIE